jgi:hypothetical protein
MGNCCNTPDLEKVVDKVTKAKESIDKLAKMVEDQESVNKASFYEKIDEALLQANISDKILEGYDSHVKLEFSSEFNIAAITKIVTASIKAIFSATSSTKVEAYRSEESIGNYVDVVNMIGEAAKSSAAASASKTFTMIRLAPGIFGFIQAKSESITQKETFGEESVTATAFYYVTVRSENSLKNDAKFDMIKSKMDHNATQYKGALNQLGVLLERLTIADIGIDEYLAQELTYEKMIDRYKEKIEKDTAIQPKGLQRRGSAKIYGSKQLEAVVSNALAKLATKSDKYNVIIHKSKKLLNKGYFLGKLF